MCQNVDHNNSPRVLRFPCRCLIFTLKARYSYFRLRDISGPLPTFFFGHFDTIWATRSYSHQLQSYTRQFGSVYGIFEGTRPFYVVSDVDFLQQVFIQQFLSFNSHRVSFLHQLCKTVHLVSVEPTRWRQQRHAINPAFSAAKLKLVTPHVDQCIESLMKKLSEMKDKLDGIWAALILQNTVRCARFAEIDGFSNYSDSYAAIDRMTNSERCRCIL